MAALADPGRSAAVLIGVHDYLHLEGLPAVAANLEALRRVLTDPAVWGLPAGACTVIAQPGSARQVLDTVREKAREATDTLLVYYAGHGLTDDYTDELHLTLPDTVRDSEYTALRYESLRRAVLDPQARARRTVVVLDCCYSGRALAGAMSAGEHIADQAVINGSVVLTATSATRAALAPPGERYTAFSGELIGLLEAGLPGGPDLLDMETLFRQLAQRLSEKSRPIPQKRSRDDGSRIAIARNRAAAVRPAPSGAPGHGERRAGEERRRTAEADAREKLRQAARLVAVLAAKPDPDFALFWLAVPVARELFGEGSLEPVGVVEPGTWYLAVDGQGGALRVQLADGTTGFLLDVDGIQNGNADPPEAAEPEDGGPEAAEPEFSPYWLAVPATRPLLALDGSWNPVGEVRPGTWYLGVEERGAALVVQLPDGTQGLLLDLSGIQRDGTDHAEAGEVDFVPFWFVLPLEHHPLMAEDGSDRRVGVLEAGRCYLALQHRGQGLLVQASATARGLLRTTHGVRRGTKGRAGDVRRLSKLIDAASATGPSPDFQPFWFAVPEVRPLFGATAREPVGVLLPGSWYLALEARGTALVAQLRSGRKGLLLDAAGIQRG
ncbi:caspase family protein [Kitasatospora sp. NPDC048538]|uniref:caspase, EACC1-associated type n=1 Tax=unclassified Kitasatospora TaxID=2633591 RepID=UPI00340A1D9C